MYLSPNRPVIASFKRNGPASDEIEIIGVEFTIRLPGGRVEELMMFSTPGLIIPRVNPVGRYEPRITFHTNDGDYTMDGFNTPPCPW